MADLEHARALVRLARLDLNALKGMGDPLVFADTIFGFHVQQAVEKAAKAWLAGCDRAYPLTHDLARLFSLLASTGADLEPFWSLDRFTPYAVQVRYAEGLPEPGDVLDRAAIVADVSALLDHVGAILGEDEA